jgi:hypothetical protein
MYIRILLLTGLPLLLAACTTKSPDALALVADYSGTANAHDIDGVMAMFAEDAQFELVGQGTLPNLQAIRALHEYDKCIQTAITLQNCAAGGLTVTCEIVETSDWLDAAELDEVFYPSAVFAFNEDGRLQRITAALSPEDGAAMGGVMSEFMPWLMANRAEQAAPLFGPEGQFIDGEANGKLVVLLL